MRKQKGFSLIELLIVVAIILIIAAIAVPNLLRSRMSANEASAVGSMRSINTAEVAYSTNYPTVGYSVLLADLGGTCSATTAPTSTSACLIDQTLAGATSANTSKSGYYFTYAQVGGGPGYTLNGDAAQQGSSGVKHFYTDASAVIRYNTSAAATASDAAIQ